MPSKKKNGAPAAAASNGTPSSSAATPAATTRKSDSGNASSPVSSSSPSSRTRPVSAKPVLPWPIVVAGTLLWYALLASTTLWLHYRLPPPLSLATSQQSVSSGLGARFSEEAALGTMRSLVDDIGYRIVGTEQHVRAEEWLLSRVRSFEGVHDTSGNASWGTQVEVWHQVGDGAHRFDFMSNVVWKKYFSMSNVIVRLSDGSEESKEHAVLLNAHLDSTLPSPGAADDGVSVAILLELLRIYTTAPRPRLRHSVILLFNNGEESLQDASHLYTTQHNETRHSVRAVINLEACGTSGPELLFQATSAEMIEAYAKVPHPFGTVLANDVFSTGLILSDTDFRQFVEYGGLSGLDMAIVGNSYLYHTRKDLPENMQPGVAQHFGENVLAIVDHLTSSTESKLPTVRPYPRRAPPIYFSIAGKIFLLFTPSTFRSISMTLAALANFQLSTAVRLERHLGSLKATTLSIVGTVLSLLAGIVSANGVALVMTKVLNRGMSWFTREWFAVVLYAPPAMLGILSVQLGISHLMRHDQRAYLERASLGGLTVFFVIMLLGFNAAGIGSAYLFALGAATCVIAVFVNDFALIGFGAIDGREVSASNRVHPATYLLLAIVPATVGVEGLVSFLDLFVPLTGRMGEISPADNIIASLVGGLTFLCAPFALPLSHRLGTKTLSKALVALFGVTSLLVAIFASGAVGPYDEWHPKRVFVHQVENITSGAWFMNVGCADPAPGMRRLVDDMHGLVGIPGKGADLMEMNAWNTDFDILYPVSDFLTPYKFQLPTPNHTSLWAHETSPPFAVHARDEHLDLEAGTRRVTLEIRHPGIIWSVIAFDGHVLEWDLPVAVPAGGHQRHHIKEVSRHGVDTWSVQLLLKLDEQGLEAARKRLADAAGLPPKKQAASGGGAGGGSGSRFSLPKLRSSASSPSAADEDRTTLVRVRALEEGEEEAPPRDASRLWVDYSGLDALGLWSSHPSSSSSAWAAAAAAKTVRDDSNRPGLATFARLDEALKRTHPEVDAMLLNVVAGVAEV